MNFFWCMLMLVSILTGIVNGNTEAVITAGFNGAGSAVETVISFAGVMCLWNGLLEAATKSGLSDAIKRIMMPLLKIIFPGIDGKSDAMNYMSLNITANMLGTGNGATPMGIKAMKELNKRCRGKPDMAMVTFAVMNTAAFQLVPSSIIAMRGAYGSANPFGIVTPVWICSGISLFCAVMSVKIMFLFLKEKK